MYSTVLPTVPYLSSKCFLSLIRKFVSERELPVYLVSDVLNILIFILFVKRQGTLYILWCHPLAVGRMRLSFNLCFKI